MLEDSWDVDILPKANRARGRGRGRGRLAALGPEEALALIDDGKDRPDSQNGAEADSSDSSDSKDSNSSGVDDIEADCGGPDSDSDSRSSSSSSSPPPAVPAELPPEAENPPAPAMPPPAARLHDLGVHGKRQRYTATYYGFCRLTPRFQEGFAMTIPFQINCCNPKHDACQQTLHHTVSGSEETTLRMLKMWAQTRFPERNKRWTYTMLAGRCVGRREQHFTNSCIIG